jgi:hypothetical protein
MNIEQLARTALDILKSTNSDFPKEGIIAGGALGNLIWGLVSGHKAPVNDIDVFIFEKLIDKSQLVGETITKQNQKVFYRSQEKIYWKEYTGFCEGTKTNHFYLIERTENEGIYNKVFYSATANTADLVIDSFDINCTQIGYDIVKDKFVWTPEFKQFLEDGQLKLTNLGSPHHSVIRILKKRDELSAKLDDFEIKIAAYCVSRPLNGITRRYFSDKYYNYFIRYQEELSKYFEIKEESEISELIQNTKGVKIGIYTLNPLVESSQIFTQDEIPDEVRKKTWHCNDFLFFIRNIQKDTLEYKIWSKLQQLYVYDGYVDCQPNDDDLDLLERLIKNIPGVIENLKGLSLNKQIKLVKYLIENFKEDPTVAFAILENQRISTDIILDDHTKLLLELSVRLKIINNNYQVDLILGKPNDLIF